MRGILRPWRVAAVGICLALLTTLVAAPVASAPAAWKLGSLPSGGASTPTPNTPEAWADMVDSALRLGPAHRVTSRG